MAELDVVPAEPVVEPIPVTAEEQPPVPAEEEPHIPVESLSVPPMAVPVEVNFVTEKQAESTAFFAAVAEDPTFETYNEIKQGYTDLIKAGAESQIRSDFAQKKLEEETQRNSAVMQGALIDGDGELAKAVVDLQISLEFEDKQAAIEEKAIETITRMAITDPDQAYLVATMAEDGTTLQQVEDFNKKLAWFQVVIDRSAADADARGLPRKVWDFIGSLMTLNISSAEVGNVENASALSDVLNLSRRIGLESTAIFQGENTYGPEWREEVELVVQKALDGSAYFSENLDQVRTTLNNYITEHGIIQLSEGQDSINARNALSLLDAIPIISLGTAWKLLRGGASAVVGTAMNKSLKAEIEASVIEGSSKVTSKNQATHDLLPTSQQSSLERLDDSISGEINTILERNSLLQTVGKEMIDRLTFNNMDDIDNIVAKTISGSPHGTRVVDIPRDTINLTEGYGSVLFGTTKGKPFKSQKLAEATASRNGWTKQTIEETSDGWVIKFEKQKLDTSGTISAANLDEVGKGSQIRSMFMSLKSVTTDRLIQSIQHSNFTHQALAKQVMTPMIKTIQKLSKKEGVAVGKVMEEGLKNNKWYTAGELKSTFRNLNGREMADKEIAAYYTAKDINDLEWIIRNNSFGIEKEAQGWRFLKGGSLDDPMMARELKSFSGEYVVDLRTGKQFTEAKVPKGYRVVEFHDVVKRPDDTNVKFALINDTENPLTNLPKKLLSYNGGGHRIYEGKFFVKQTVTGTAPGIGKYVSTPKTHIVSVDKKDAEVWADQMNQALDIYKAYTDRTITSEMADDMFRSLDKVHIEGTSDMIKKLFSGKMTRNKFEVVYDKELPKSTEDFIGQGHRNFVQGGDAVSDMYMTQGKLYYSKRGDHLVDPKNEHAAIVSPFQATSVAMNNALKNGSLTNYRLEAIGSWFEAAAGKLDNAYGSPVDAFVHGRFKSPTGKGVEQLNTLRDVIKRQLTTETEEGRWLNNQKASLKKWVYEKDFKGKDVALWAIEQDPIKAMRGVAFDTKLGFGDPSQLIIQTQTMFAAMSLSPKFGFEAMSAMPAIKIAMMNQSDEMLNYLAKNWKGLGMEAEEFKTLVKSLRRSGILNVGGEVAMLNNFGEQIAMNSVKHIRTAREIMRIPFYQAEQFNRITAYGIAWRELKATQPKLNMESSEAIRILSQRVDDYSMNMTAASAAKWQKGWLSAATQFMSYQFRLTENVLVGNFTVPQKIRLGMMQAVMYGSAGVPAADWALDTIFGEDQNDVKTFLETGAWDKLIWGPIVTGELKANPDTNFSDRAGVGAGMANFITSFTDKPVLEFMGGASYSIVFGDKGITKSILDIGHYFATEEVGAGYITKKVALDLSSHIASLSRLTRALMVAESGEFVDSIGRTVADAPNREWLASALGIPMKEVEDVYDLQKRIRAIKDATKDAYDLGLKLRLDTFRNPERAEDNAAVIQSILQTLPTGVRLDVRNRFNRRHP